MGIKIHTLDLKFMGHDDTIAAFLIDAEGELALVESGPHSTYTALKVAVSGLGYNFADIKKVFLTHIHFDHAGAAWALARENNATIYVHPFGLRHLQDPTKLYNSAKQIYGDKMEVLWGNMEGIAPENLHATENGEKIPLGKINMLAWHTPGHAVHHIAWQFGGDVFAGDVAGVKIGNGIVVPPCPPPDINLEDWQKSLDVLRGIKMRRLHLTHFGAITQVKKHLNSLEKRLFRWANWIKPYYESHTPAAEVTPKYAEMVRRELARFGITGENYAQYESANPAWMSVAGLLRYWHKKNNP